MSRIVPYPLTSAGLLALWLLLNQSISLGHILIGGAIALAGGWSLAALKPPATRPRKLATIVRLAGRVTWDIILSNIAVAGIILGAGRDRRAAGFVEIPLDLRNPSGLTVLACIVTSTPGTLWVEFRETSGILTIHVLDLVDEARVIDAIKSRYERPLLEIFP
jgi:multicomponent K+:H+ antiporter subunit E